MQTVIEIPASIVAAFCALGALLITIGGIVVKQAVSQAKNESSAKAARAIADEAKAEAGHARADAVAALQAVADFRERVAREYASRETIRELEERLVRVIERLGDRFDRYVDAKKKEA